MSRFFQTKIPLLAATVGVLVLALWTRLARLHEVVHDGEILPIDGDCAFHYRRIFLTLEHFPHVPVYDPWMNWPLGANGQAAPGFDFLLAALALPASADSRVLVVALAPVLLGLVVVAVAMVLERRLLGSSGLVAGILAATVPQLVAISRFSRVDHHVLETLVMGALALWVLSPSPRRWPWEAAGAAIIAGGVACFAGSIVYVAIAALMLVLARRPDDPPFRGAAGIAGGALLSLLVARGQVAQHHHAWSYAFLSWLQPLLVLVAAGGLAWVDLFRRASTTRRAVLLAPAVVVGALVLATAPGREVVAGVQSYLLTSDPWLASIQEFQPFARTGFVATAWDYWGVQGVLAPILFPLGIAAAVRMDRRRGAAFALWTVALLLLTLAQSRFGRVLALNLVLCSALSLSLLPRLVAIGPILALLLVGFDPQIRAMLAVRSTPPLPAVPEAMLYLRGKPADGPAIGVLAPWDYGYDVLWLGKRPVVTTGMGTYLDPAGFHEEARAWTLDEPSLLRWMDERKLGVVLGGSVVYVERPGPEGKGIFLHQDGIEKVNPAYLRRVPLARSLVGGSGIAAWDVPHLQGLMPIFASTTPVEGKDIRIPGLWLMERVAGAHLVGTAAPNSRVVARIPLRTAVGTLVHEAWVDADEQGRFDLVEPVPSGQAMGGFDTAPTVTIAAGDVERTIDLPIEAVRQGRTIDLGVLDPRALTPRSATSEPRP